MSGPSISFSIKKNRDYIQISLKSIFSVLLSSPAKVRSRLADLLTKMAGGDQKVLLTKSGRNALFMIFCLLKSKQYSRALIPYRICNVLEMSASLAGLGVVAYKDDDEFMRILNSDSFSHDRSTALVVASYFNKKIKKSRVVDLFLERYGQDAPVIFDECQSVYDFSFYMKYKNLNNKFLVISFNNKFVPGVMGGAVLSGDRYDLTLKRMSLGRELIFYLFFLKGFINYLLNGAYSGIIGEFSVPTGFRSRLDTFGISHVSAFVAVQFLYSQDKIKKRLLENNKVLTCNKSDDNEIQLYNLIKQSMVSRYASLPLKGPYLIRKDEPLNDAINDTGGIFIVNSFRYIFSTEIHY